MDIQKALQALNMELARSGRSFVLYVCGGAALRLLGIISRDTSDIDVIADVLDPLVVEAKNKVAQKLRISEDWINNKVNPIAERLPAHWMDHCVEVFKASNLTVYSLSRQDLISSKVHAAVDRHSEDLNDLIDMKPTPEELATARAYTIEQGESETYPVFVDGIIRLLKKELGYK
ncbi:MAG: hypothetical protein A2583_07905 [Bdellovibrionales bacterium RIFOXYD1_FULL_53_11]|nr:MAG: hypothetical protein A2583_07905 [Bdellovibrionales bacterium RIFOXYD1_FULL_53_11]